MNILINEYIQQQNNNLIKSDSKNVYNVTKGVYIKIMLCF